MSDTSNQQERLLDCAWLAGLAEGEGNFSLVMGSKNRIFSKFNLINTDMELIEETCKAMHRLGVGHYVALRRGGCDNNPKHADAKVVVVVGYKRMATLIDALLPYMRGKKREVATLVREYISYRMSKSIRAAYTSVEFDYVSRVRALNKKGPKGIPRDYTLAPTPVGEDIVQTA